MVNALDAIMVGQGALGALKYIGQITTETRNGEFVQAANFQQHKKILVMWADTGILTLEYKYF